MKRIMLLVTENCNLHCCYCYEHNKSEKNMPLETARTILDAHLKNAKKNVPIVIELFGGEAFENFPLIKEIDAYLVDTYPDLDIRYETTTNGTLIHGEIREWLYERRDKFFIALSLDGTKEMHNMNRRFASGNGSFQSIDIPFFAQTWKNCPAKMTLSEKTLPYLAEGVRFLDSLGFKCDATLSIGVEWNQEKNLPILTEELGKLVTYYTENPNTQLCTMLNQDLRLIFTPIGDDYRFCGAGLDMVCYDTQGHKYPCQGFAPVSISEQSKDYSDFDETRFRFTDTNKCRQCPWVRLCPNCYAANLQSTGDIQRVDENLCNFFQLCIMASAKIQCSRILQKNSFSQDDKLILKAISIIQKQMLSEL